MSGSSIRVTLAALALGACATTQAVAPAETGVVHFTNTSSACGHALPVAVALGRERARVDPGESARLEVPVGEHVAVIRAADGSEAELTRETWSVIADDVSERFFGCAAPRFVVPAPGRVPIVVSHTPWGCRPGAPGVTRLAVDGEAFAQVSPGRTATRLVPPGRLVVRVEPADAAPRDVVVEVSADGGGVEVGCAAAEVAGPKVAVLAVFGPGAACPRGSARTISAAGMTTRLAREEALTLVLPPGRARVVTRDDAGAAVVRWLDLVVGGNVLAGPPCGDAAER